LLGISAALPPSVWVICAFTYLNGASTKVFPILNVFRSFHFVDDLFYVLSICFINRGSFWYSMYTMTLLGLFSWEEFHFSTSISHGNTEV
jgi:hypothetical protein